MKLLLSFILIFTLLSCANDPFKNDQLKLSTEKPSALINENRSIEGFLQEIDSTEGKSYIVVAQDTRYKVMNPNPTLVKLTGSDIYKFEGEISKTKNTSNANTIFIEKVLKREKISFSGKLLQIRNDRYQLDYSFNRNIFNIIMNYPIGSFTQNRVYKITGNLFYQDKTFYITDPTISETDLFEAVIKISLNYCKTSDCTMSESSYFNALPHETYSPFYYDFSEASVISNEALSNFFNQEYNTINVLKYQAEILDPQNLNIIYNLTHSPVWIKTTNFDYTFSSFNKVSFFSFILNDPKQIIPSNLLKDNPISNISYQKTSPALRVFVKINNLTYLTGSSYPTIYRISLKRTDKKEAPSLYGPSLDLASIEEILN